MEFGFDFGLESFQLYLGSPFHAAFTNFHEYKEWIRSTCRHDAVPSDSQ